MSTHTLIRLVLLTLVSTPLVMHWSPRANAAPESTSPEARVKRQQIVSELDRRIAAARKEYRVRVDVVPALRACAPLDAAVEDCRVAADKVAEELERRIQRAAAKEISPTKAPDQAVSITVINQNDIYIRPQAPTAIPVQTLRPRSPP